MHFKKCEICGKIFYMKRKGMNCCSRKCRDIFTLYKKGQKCIVCNNIFYIKQRTMFCSEKCKKDFKESKLEKKKCLNCDNVFYGDKIQKFCSPLCKSHFNKNNYLLERECDYCHKKFIGSKYFNKGIKNTFCCHSCCMAFLYKQNKITQKFSTQHKKCDLLLKNMGINYINEKSFYKYSLDIYLLDYNLGIEIMGSYWHGDIRRYPIFETMQERQKYCVKKDKRKKEFLNNNGIKVLYLWEYDIDKDLLKCKNLIKNFIEGKLQFYHSSDYILENNELIFSKEKDQFMELTTTLND